MYNASHYRRPSSFVWTVCKGDWVPEQPPPSSLLTAALGSIPPQASWMLQDSSAPLKERIKKEKLYLCVVEGPLFSCWTFIRSYHYFAVPFPCFEDCMSLSFQASCPFCLLLALVLLLQTCMSCLKGIALFSIHGLLLFPFLCCSRNGACLRGIWLSAYTYPLVFHSLLLYAVELLFSAADTMSASEVCVREILSSHFSRRLSPGNAEINRHLTFPDTRT